MKYLLTNFPTFPEGSVLTVYSTEFQVENKADKSPLTEADKRAHQAIVKGLTSTKLPILSEEGKSIPYDERKSWEKLKEICPAEQKVPSKQTNEDWNHRLKFARQRLSRTIVESKRADLRSS